MNREIKFRAYDLFSKEMVNNIQYFASFDKDGLINVEPQVVLMQYTGLHDKNGKEIFEGDILAHHFDKGLLNWVVSFNNGCFVITNISKDGEVLHDKWQVDSGTFIDREIIGNIYEHTQLVNT